MSTLKYFNKSTTEPLSQYNDASFFAKNRDGLSVVNSEADDGLERYPRLIGG